MLNSLYSYVQLRWWPLCVLAVLLGMSLAGLRVGHTQTGPIELVARRTLTTKTFRNPNNTFTLKAYGGPVHYYDANGRLQDLNLNLYSTTQIFNPGLGLT